MAYYEENPSVEDDSPHKKLTHDTIGSGGAFGTNSEPVMRQINLRNMF